MEKLKKYLFINYNSIITNDLLFNISHINKF